MTLFASVGSPTTLRPLEAAPRIRVVQHLLRGAGLLK
jgi:hypothetical protein